MRTYVLLIFIVFVYFINCSKDKDPISIVNNYSSYYFPLKVGNTWYYNYPTPQTDPWAMKTIESSFIKNNTMFYRWTYGEGVDIIDTIRTDMLGNIWKLVNNEEYLWFDFSQDSGSTYIWSEVTYNPPWGSGIINYNVNVGRNVSIETPAGVFDNCISLFFNNPQVKDEEMYYVFAPNIGPVTLGPVAWALQCMTTAIIDGDTIGE